MVDVRVYAHVIPGCLLLAVASFLSVVCYKRLRNLVGRLLGEDLGSRYGDDFFPEPNKQVLKGCGVYYMIAALVGYLGLTIAEIPQGMPLFGDTAHLMLHFLYFSVGLVCVLEGFLVVPGESSRVALGLTFALEFVMLVIHSSMKATEVEKIQHYLAALITLLSSISLFMSVACKHWLAPYVVFLASFAWQGLRWITIGLCFLSENVKYEDAPIYFCLEGMFLLFIGLAGSARLQKAREKQPSYKRTIVSQGGQEGDAHYDLENTSIDTDSCSAEEDEEEGTQHLV